MPDPSITLTAIQSHAGALDAAIRRHAANAGRCKVWSVGVVAGVVLFAAGRAQMSALPWAAGVVVLLALADACQVVMARVCTDAYNGFMRKLPLNGGNAMKPSTRAQAEGPEECFVLPAPEPGWRQAGQVLEALGSLSVLPFYGALLALVVTFHVQMSAGQGDLENRAERDSLSQTARRAAPEALATSAKPVPSTVKPSLPVTVISRPTPGGGQSAPNRPPSANMGSPSAMQPSQSVPKIIQPGQAPALSPLRPLQPQQPGVRLPAQPPPRFPTNAVPANAASPSGVPVQNGVPAQAPGAGGTPALQPTVPPGK